MLLHGSADLTSREWAIAALVSQGLTDAQLAVEMQTREDSVYIELRRILEKTGCWNRTELALWYLKMGVQRERRFDDRREANWERDEERRRHNRRLPPNVSPRASEEHQIKLDE